MKPKFPWLQLKLAEEVLRQRYWQKKEAEPILVFHFSNLLEECSNDPNAEDSVAYHASMALKHELDDELESAIACRRREISLIEKLHELAAANPSDQSALWLYDDDELANRKHILAMLQALNEQKQGG